MANKSTKKSWERTATSLDRSVRLDKFWADELYAEGVSRGRVREWIEAGGARIDGNVVTKGKFKLQGFETLVLEAGAGLGAGDMPEAVAGGLDVVFEDEHVAVVDKTAGLTTHPAPGEPGSTLVNLLLHRFPDMAGPASGLSGERPGIVHRLDKDTSGLIAVARTEADRVTLSADFAARRVHKTYLAIVHGRPEPAVGVIEADIGRHPTRKTRMAVVKKGGREAVSDYRVLWTGPRGLASLVAVRIHTGRTHQIRVHMAHIGHPLLGDAVYGSREQAEWERRPDRLAVLAPRQMLHAFHLSFIHPANGERITLWREPPEDFRTLLAGLSRECFRVGIVGMPGGGKSALRTVLEREGLPCFSADDCVAALYAPGGDGAAMIGQRFGGIYTLDDGGVDKRKLFSGMLESDSLRREITEMVHPMVSHACEEFFRAHRDEPVAFAEIPLLLESGWHRGNRVDAVAGVHCPVEKRTGELRELRKLSREMLATFDSWQWSEEDKLAACDFVAENDGDLDRLAEEAHRLAEWAKEMSQARERDVADWLTGLWPRLAEEFTAAGEAEETGQ
ncbi:dephospho-CoA kinase [Pseudodesulfovibrio sp.]|uniref:dephospho-CoA kinase n=1 Tax=unclassified Pseudodesulfovibrio TaxID=2661612 RepID=UPI003B00180E